MPSNNLVKCVLTISFWNLVTSITVNENSGIVQRRDTNDTRHKRFFNFPPEEWAWLNNQEYQQRFLNDYQYSHQNNFNYLYNNYNERQHSTYDLPGKQRQSNFDPYVNSFYSNQKTEIPPKIYFNQQPTRTVFQPVQPAYVPNIYEENYFYSNNPNNLHVSLPSYRETNRIIPYHNPTQIYINLHIHNIIPTNEIRNGQISQDGIKSPPNLLHNLNPNVSPKCPPFSQFCSPNTLLQNVPQNLQQNTSQYRGQNFSPAVSPNSPLNTQQNPFQNFLKLISQMFPPNTPQRNSQNLTLKMLQNNLQNSPLNTSQNLQKTVPQTISQNLLLTNTQSPLQFIPQMIPQNLAQNITQNFIQNNPLNTPANFLQNSPQIIPQNFPQIIPQNYPQPLPQTFPQYRPPSFPQYLPPSIPNLSQNTSPNFPNINPNIGTNMLSPISDRLAEDDDIDGTIDAKVFGSGVNLGDQIIGPTGSLRKKGLQRVPSVAISCDAPYTPPKMPNFQKPGRRISETKCYEYIFQLKTKDELERRNQFCNNKSVSNNNSNNKSRRQIDMEAFLIGGQKAAPEEFPHMAAIGWRGVNEPVIFKCGGSLISPNFLLTAAHCRSSAPDTELVDLVPRIARIGGNNIGYKKSGQAFEDLRRRRQTTDDAAQLDVGIMNIITHEQYDPNRKYYDIALMQLTTSLDFNRRLKPACLWLDLETSNRIRRAVASGWGVVNPRNGRTSLNLQAGELDIIDSNRCNDLLRAKFGSKFNGFENHQLCAGKLSGGIDVCQGDSGGPLQVKVKLPVSVIGNIHSIVGIISAGPDCGKPDMPGIYTRVASFIDWIEPKVWN